MTIERHFPLLDAPAGGLERLQSRLDRTERHRVLRPVAALAAVLGALVLIPWLHDAAQIRQGRAVQLDEIRRTLAEHRSPDLSINGQDPKPLNLSSDRVEAYFLNGSG